MRVEVRTQAEFDAALTAGNTAVCVSGDFSLVTTGAQAPEIVLFAAANLRVEAWGSSRPSVVAWGSSQPSVEARESSQPRVVARG
ncbi:MAG: hypothetical protein U0872_14270 [Planctomycetaceae bacterium]